MMEFLSVVILSGIIATVIFVTILYKGVSGPIVIKHELNPYGWFEVHAMTYFLTIMMLLIIDLISFNMSNITGMSMSLVGIGVLFVQNGGLVIVVMILSSIIYNHLIRSIKFHYYVSHHQWLKKIFFSCVCVSLVIMYSIEAIKNPDEINILGDEYKLIVFWIITIVQIWIGFGMNIELSKLGNMDYLSGAIHRISKNLQSLKARKEEFRYMMLCVVSMLVFPVIIPLFLWFADEIPQRCERIIYACFTGTMFGSLISIIISIGIIFIHTKSCWCSNKRFHRAFQSADDKKKTRYYQGVKYQLWKNERGYYFSICQEKVEFVNENSFPKRYLKRAKRLFQGKKEILYLFEEYEENEIKELIHKELVSFSTMREIMLKEGWNIVYKLVDEKAKRLK